MSEQKTTHILKFEGVGEENETVIQFNTLKETIQVAREAMMAQTQSIQKRFSHPDDVLKTMREHSKEFGIYVAAFMDSPVSVSLLQSNSSALSLVRGLTSSDAPVGSIIRHEGENKISTTEAVVKSRITIKPKDGIVPGVWWLLPPTEDLPSPLNKVTLVRFQTQEQIEAHLKDPEKAEVYADFLLRDKAIWKLRDCKKYLFIRIVENVPPKYWNDAQSLAGTGVPDSAITIGCNIILCYDGSTKKFTQEMYFDGCERCGRTHTERNLHLACTGFVCEMCEPTPQTSLIVVGSNPYSVPNLVRMTRSAKKKTKS